MGQPCSYDWPPSPPATLASFQPLREEGSLPETPVSFPSPLTYMSLPRSLPWWSPWMRLGSSPHLHGPPHPRGLLLASIPLPVHFVFCSPVRAAVVVTVSQGQALSGVPSEGAPAWSCCLHVCSHCPPCSQIGFRRGLLLSVPRDRFQCLLLLRLGPDREQAVTEYSTGASSLSTQPRRCRDAKTASALNGLSLGKEATM